MTKPNKTSEKITALMFAFLFVFVMGIVTSHIFIGLFGKSEWDKGYNHCLKQRMYKANNLDMPEVAGAGSDTLQTGFANKHKGKH